jgi:hypothetical protein
MTADYVFYANFCFLQEDKKFYSVALLGSFFRTDPAEAKKLSKNRSPQGLPLVTPADVHDDLAVELHHVECVVAAFHTCYVTNPQCQVIDVCIAHKKKDCTTCPRDGKSWNYALFHHTARQSYYILDAAHGYIPHP